MRTTTAITAAFFALASPVLAGTAQEAIDNARANSAQYYTDVQRLPESVTSGLSQTSTAKQVIDTVNSKAFQDRVQKEHNRLQREMFGGGSANRPGAYYADSQPTVAGQIPHLAADERIYLFISSSMPLSTLRNYARGIDRLRDPRVVMVVRGFVDGIQDGTKTMEFFMQIRLKDLGCSGANCATFSTQIDIDPNLYRRFRPASVPALVYVRGVHPVDPDVSEGSPENVPVPSPSSWTMIYGDAALSYLFGRTADTTKSPTLAAMSHYLGR
ncbi:TrbC family F-type conjugative pilus assembly protein [Geobacter sp. FeAm09]|uniref:TrbC family F-type conjugative pilus assembly protein n=1 Tax=Geobacter sp. FeAm09 TaxID=2597769 RepID=UPI00197A9222|nr:TrbC family F-type conjugative pilus assembly protein [Geobacter sp. FeAm09]